MNRKFIGGNGCFQSRYNTIYFRYFENARLLYFEESGILEMMQKSQTGPIMAHRLPIHQGCKIP